MFRRELYRSMARVLEAFDADLLERTQFRFAGGTRIALAHDELRLSRDIDFVCSDARGYAELRTLVRQRDHEALLVAEKTRDLTLPREIRVDQYGLRFPVIVEGTTIRVELIREARIALGPAEHASWTELPLLSIADTFAEKLLANSDRGADSAELARDLVDLAILRQAHGAIPASSWQAAEHAYGEAPRLDLLSAGERFLADPTYQERCFTGLGVEDPATVLSGTRAIVTDLGGAP